MPLQTLDVLLVPIQLLSYFLVAVCLIAGAHGTASPGEEAALNVTALAEKAYLEAVAIRCLSRAARVW